MKLAALPVSFLAYDLTLNMEAVYSSKMQGFLQTTQHYNPEDQHVLSHHHENLSSNNMNSCYLFQLLNFLQKLLLQMEQGALSHIMKFTLLLFRAVVAMVYSLCLWFKSSFLDSFNYARNFLFLLIFVLKYLQVTAKESKYIKALFHSWQGWQACFFVTKIHQKC